MQQVCFELITFDVVHVFCYASCNFLHKEEFLNTLEYVVSGRDSACQI
jgi:hypothetical protein